MELINFRKIDNQLLESQFQNVVKSEREILHTVLQYIREVDKRKLYLERGYPTLYKYLVQRMNYSGPSAQRRIEAMRLMKAVPELAQKIESGAINLSQVGVLSRAVKQKEQESKTSLSAHAKSELVALIENKEVADTQQMVSAALDIPLKEPETKIRQKDESVHLSITLSKEQYAKLMSCKDLAAHLLLQKNSTAIADVIEVLADKFIQSKTLKKSAAPSATESRTFSISKDRQESQRTENPGAISDRQTSASSAGAKINKTLTPKTRKIILTDQKCCQYRDPITHKTCGSRFALEVDHKQSRWAGGDHSSENLQVLCSRHNKWKYDKERFVFAR